MFGWLRPRAAETRSAEIDLGALYASFFQFGTGAYSLATEPGRFWFPNLSVLDNAGALLTEARRLGQNKSPLLIAYRSVIESGLLCGEPESPAFADSVPEGVAAAVADMWIDVHDIERERDLLDRLVLDGEFLELDDG